MDNQQPETSQAADANCSTISSREPLVWIVPIIECDDLELQTISALGGVMKIFAAQRPRDAPIDSETTRRIVTWFADKYAGLRIR